MIPFFSLVIPTYNRNNSVQITIESILKQSFTEYEIIAVDDGSSDKTFETLSNLYTSIPQIKIIRQENKERGAARNNGFRHAIGEYVQFIDSDDLIFPDHLKILHEKIVQLNFPDFICTKFELYRNGRSSPAAILKLPETYYDYTLFLSGNPLACNICLKRNNPGLKLFEEDRNYSIKEDWMFMIQNLRHNKVYIIDKVTIRMGDHDDRSMRSNNQLIIERTYRARDWVLSNVELNEAEKRTLNAHVNYFSSIHSYIDNRRIDAFKYLSKAIGLMGIHKKYVSLFLKILAGQNQVNQFKRLFHW